MYLIYFLFVFYWNSIWFWVFWWPLRKYNSFFHSIQEQQVVNSEQMAAYINQWQELSDTVFHYLEKDPAFTAHAGLSMVFAENTDSIRTVLLRLADKCTLTFVFLLLARHNPSELGILFLLRASVERCGIREITHIYICRREWTWFLKTGCW